MSTCAFVYRDLAPINESLAAAAVICHRYFDSGMDLLSFARSELD